MEVRGLSTLHPARSLSGYHAVVTGGTGSLGRRLVKRLLDENVESVVVYSRDEKKQYDMQHQAAFADPRVHYVIGDVRDAARVREALCGADVVFQAAALKHVVGCEANPFEAVQTNVVGVHNVVEAAREAGVAKLVAISTDKACRPVNVMGMTKALQERIVLKAGYTAVRYGNVVGSRGSVVPYFKSLLESGETELPLTHPDMTRFLMSIREAVDLVMLAFDAGVGGEIFVRKAPAAKVSDVAYALARMLGKPAPTFAIGGMTHGEKLDETLVAFEESFRTVEYELGFVIRPSGDPIGEGYEYGSGSDLLTPDQIVPILETALPQAIEGEEGYFSKA